MGESNFDMTRNEYLVLIEYFNALADAGVDVRRRRLFDGEVVELEVLPFIAKLLEVGERNGWVSVPCGRRF